MQSNPEQETQDLYEFLKDGQFLDDLREKGILVTGPPQTSKPVFRARQISDGKCWSHSFLSAYQRHYQKEPLVQPPYVAIETEIGREGARQKELRERARKKPEFDPFTSWNPASWVPSPQEPYNYMLMFEDPYSRTMLEKIFHWVFAEPKSVRETLKRGLEDYIDLDKLSLSDLCSLHVGGADLSSVRSKHLFTVDEYDCQQRPVSRALYSQRLVLEEFEEELKAKHPEIGRGLTKPVGYFT